MSETITDKSLLEQMRTMIRAEVTERNEYRRLLDECLFCLNQLPNQRIDNSQGLSTYALAGKIETAFKKFDNSPERQLSNRLQNL